MAMPYKYDTTEQKLQKQLDLMKKEFDEKLKQKDVKFQEEIKKEVDAKENIQKTLQEEIKKEVVAKETIQKTLQEEVKKESSAKETIQKMLDDVKNKQKEGEIDCPTCGTGHVHRLQVVGKGDSVKGVGDKGSGHGVAGRYKCTGPDCGAEHIVADITSDYYCKDCNLPHRKPKDEKVAKTATCLYCGGENFGKLDWKAKLDKLRKARGG